jgi:hypothetical protein
MQKLNALAEASLQEANDLALSVRTFLILDQVFGKNLSHHSPYFFRVVFGARLVQATIMPSPGSRPSRERNKARLGRLVDDARFTNFELFWTRRELGHGFSSKRHNALLASSVPSFQRAVLARADEAIE